MPDYSKLDTPDVLSYVFYPRQESGPCPKYAFDHFIPVDDAVLLHCRFYIQENTWPWILYFHGNGEVVSDYDELSLFYFKYKLNIAVADYRGYGKSNGILTITNMSRDAHKIFESVKTTLIEKNLRNDLWIMGRSLGSVCAFEIAGAYGRDVKGLVIESGFPSISSLIIRHSIASPDMPLDAITKECLDMLHEIDVPILVIHGEYDTLVPPMKQRQLWKT